MQLRIVLIWLLLSGVSTAAADTIRPTPRVGAEVGEPALMADIRPMPRPEGLGIVRHWCADGPGTCISRATFVPDVCRVVEHVSRRNGLDPNFMTRLVWKESLFDPGAVSHAGAQGIAQFIPDTAARRGLHDPFNPAESLAASAAYLADLEKVFGNVGLAAAAYNAGEGRVAGFVAGERTLPRETRNYVYAITGYSGLAWRDHPPEEVTLALAKEQDFRRACEARVGSRMMREFDRPDIPAPWAVILAAHESEGIVEAVTARLKDRFPEVLGPESVIYAPLRLPGFGTRSRFTAQIGRQSRSDADAMCNRLRAAGGGCMVLRN
ncbi:lytic transglycosylase domain-containing protein [Algicella marina]|uniref:Transglycosylase SLT domain-containing protein n=1 Tax=Algicella marina TaxID=2683284 RepID=A0A6P1SZT3_9RHOB|nr:lytic transglycosylase domain-containing protein [Algicella marina]QHQ35998.1 transglycosylase SLT domain-containing protein [Algicella marina]